SRIILNARRMSLDVPPPATTEEVGPCLSTLSVKALKLVYDLSPDSGTERLVSFLDLCSSFRVLPLHLLDLASPEALVFFLNIYHTLLQHALLLLGPPSSKDWSAFFTNVSYEMGNDVFSLTELEHCVLRGHLARPRSVPRHMPSPPPLDDDHYLYALSKTNFRINFALVNGSLSAPPFVTVFQAGHLNEQLNRASVRFIDHTVRMDGKKRLLVLPKVCDIYRADFSAAKTGRETMKVCLRFLERAKWERISWLMAGAKAPSVKYSSMRAKCHETLCLIEDKLTTPRNAVITSIGNGAIQATTPLLESNKVASPPIPEPLLLTPVATSKGALRNSSPPLLNLDKEESSSASEDFDEEMEEDENDGGSISDELEGEASEELEAPVERDELVSGECDGTSSDNGTF
ncbi:hypothetical protein NGA_2027300, partial [Nannochloropsis gaditana CCMP526]|uniref:uncharacterized protein n=1 Tax=Nannochloropsis gaditana (strain CCMP526) TaxID=1093141 RepID=UPI00029F76DB